MPSLGATFGRGAATTSQWDLANADCVMIMGSNMAENHPIAFRFVLQAKERGATIIHADPRFTRTSALCDIYAPIRAGSDIAFLGGRHVAEQLPVIGIYYDGEPDAFANRLVNVSTRTAGAAAGTHPAWNGHEWDVRN